MSDVENDKNDGETNGKRNKVIFRLSMLLILFFLIAGIYWFFFLRNKVSTDDAYVNGYVINLTSEISAATTAFYCDNSDFVKRGDLLVELNKTDFELSFENAKNDLALSVRRVVELQQDVYQAKASLYSQRALYQKANVDFVNRQGLVESLAVTREDFEHSRESMNSAKALLSLYKHRLQAAIAALGETSLEDHPFVKNAKTALRLAFANLKRTSIYAPVTGFIAKRTIEVGKWVKPGDVMLAIISLDDVWVDANFKETQLQNIRVGQEVDMTSDIYGSSVNFTGKVLGLVPGSGSVFSLLPPQNATGNWIKIVQRVPVRILLDKAQVKEFPLLLGLSIYATIRVTDQSGLFLREATPQQAVISTDIYHIPFDEIEDLIERIILENKIVKNS
jgi:membrane fusion protein (multidrug efflux system)